jgi:hypothetical protein
LRQENNTVPFCGCLSFNFYNINSKSSFKKKVPNICCENEKLMINEFVVA